MILDQERYELVKKVIQKPDFITVEDFSTSKAEVLQSYGLAYPGIYKDKKVLVIPKEIQKAFKDINEIELKKIVNRNTEWTKLTQGLLYYYGVLDLKYIIEKIESLTGQKIDSTDYFHVISVAKFYYDRLEFSEHGLQDSRVVDAEYILEEQKMRSDLNYYPFTKDQLLKAGEPQFIEKTPAMNDLTRFLLENYDLTHIEVDAIAEEILIMINEDELPTSIVHFLESTFEFPSFEFVQELTDKIMKLHNQTRVWTLKGHSPNDLSPKRPNSAVTPKNVVPIAPLAAPPIAATTMATKPKVVDIRKNKIGRNEPCPCGSGKKYKKCCGK